MPDLSTQQARERAVAEFDGDVYAESSRASLEYKWRPVARIFDEWRVDIFHPLPR